MKRYRLEKIDELTQSIWDDVEKRRLVMFLEKDYGGNFMFNHPELIVSFLNGEKSLDKHDAQIAIKALFELSNKIAERHNEMIETIEGLKEGGKALNYVLPEPVNNVNHCVTQTELYRVQHRMAKNKWDAYYKRFYERRPGKNDEMVARNHRSDLHHMRYADGKWYFKCTFKNITMKRFLGTDEEQAKLMRDKLLNEIGYNG